MDSITLEPAQKSRLDEVASLMLQIYRTLARMKYLDPEWIVEGPHDASDTISTYRGEIDDSILYLYSILPYVDTGGAMDVDFYDGGEFARFDNGFHVDDGRNPFYADDEDERMKPWMTPLSMIGNHETSIIYSARSHFIWIFSQMGIGSVDPGLGPPSDSQPANSESGSDNQNEPDDLEEDDHFSATDCQPESEGDDRSEQRGLEESDHSSPTDCQSVSDIDDQSSQDGSDSSEEGDHYTATNCRPAVDVLRDINKWYTLLKELPGGGQHSPADWDQDLTEPLYVKHGWPRDDFNGDAFQVDRIRSFAVREAKAAAREPLEKLDQLNREVSSERHVLALLQQLESTSGTSAEWDVRWKLLIQQQYQKRIKTELKQQSEKIDRLCPGGTTTAKDEDMLFWEAEWLRVALVEKQRTLRSRRDGASKADAADPALNRSARLQLNFAQQEVNIYQRAYDEAMLDVEQLWPGESFTSVTGWEPLDTEDSPIIKLRTLEEVQANEQNDIVQFEKFLRQLPRDLAKLRDEVEDSIKNRQWSTQDHFPKMRAFLEEEKRQEKTSV